MFVSQQTESAFTSLLDRLEWVRFRNLLLPFLAYCRKVRNEDLLRAGAENRVSDAECFVAHFEKGSLLWIVRFEPSPIAEESISRGAEEWKNHISGEAKSDLLCYLSLHERIFAVMNGGNNEKQNQEVVPERTLLSHPCTNKPTFHLYKFVEVGFGYLLRQSIPMCGVF
jgi:hypothetical protein